MFKGSNVALITPFKDNKLDVEAYIKLIHFICNWFHHGWGQKPEDVAF